MFDNYMCSFAFKRMVRVASLIPWRSVALFDQMKVNAIACNSLSTVRTPVCVEQLQTNPSFVQSLIT